MFDPLFNDRVTHSDTKYGLYTWLQCHTYNITAVDVLYLELFTLCFMITNMWSPHY